MEACVNYVLIFILGLIVGLGIFFIINHMKQKETQKIAQELVSQAEDKKTLRKINELIKDIQRTPFDGKGKPEPLKYDLKGFWSRRITREHRLVYQVIENEILIYSCRYHYDK